MVSAAAAEQTSILVTSEFQHSNRTRRWHWHASNSLGLEQRQVRVQGKDSDRTLDHSLQTPLKAPESAVDYLVVGGGKHSSRAEKTTC